jgi:hypothetical protein
VVRVTEDASRRLVQLVHGGTVHGRQRRDGPVPAEPLAYYHPTGPAGEIVERFRESAASRSFAVVGLGVAALCAYARDGDEWVFYEIDEAIERIARHSGYFTFWTECRAARREVVRGDARLRLTESADRRYGMLVLDAFSADAIPLHLLTREALAVYDRKTAPGGWMVFHISSRTLDLRPMLARLAEDAGWVAYVAEDLVITPEQRAQGKDPSVWIVMARRGADVASLGGTRRWHRLRAPPKLPVWTDDFSSLWSALRWW